jgi:hypothetical protein
VLAGTGPIEPGEVVRSASTLEIRDFLGIATVDASAQEIRFRIDEGMLRQAGTPRNVHTEPDGSLPYPVRECDDGMQPDYAR